MVATVPSRASAAARTVSANPRRKTRRTAAVLLMLASTGTALLAGEALVRLALREPILPRFVFDAGYGVRDNMPGVRTRHTAPGEYAIAVTTNRDGMRDYRRDYAPGKQQGVYRIALIGDSFVFGFGVQDSETVAARLEGALNRQRGRKYAVLNFGVPGYGQAEELLNYENKVRRFAPDAAVLFYFSNDLGNNDVASLFGIDSDGRAVRTGRTYLPGISAGANIYAFPPTRWLFEHSQLWNVIRNRLSLLVQASLLRSHAMRTFNTPTAHAVNLTRALFRQFLLELRQDAVAPVVFVIPSGEMLTNFPLTAGDVREWGASCVDGRNILAPSDYFQRDTHWRPAGHDKVARALMPLLIAMADSAQAARVLTGEPVP